MNPVFEVLDGGLLTTIQDLGRPGRRFAGVPPGGAMDRFALAAANLLVGNPENTAGLECTVRPPRLRALRDCVVALAGPGFELLVDGESRAAWTSAAVAAGAVLALERRGGARAYLAVAGGLAGERWLGSASTFLPAAKGGLEGRALRQGDLLALAAEPLELPAPGRSVPAEHLPSYGSPALSTVAGPHDARLSRGGRRTLFTAEFNLLPASDRMGFRLSGPELEHRGDELLSFGTAMGCVQLTPAGPIVLMADHQTSGGYPVVACLARSALPVAGQLLPGAAVRFREVKVEAAQREWQRLKEGLGALRR